MFENTLKKGSVRYIVFKEDNVWYAVGLEFNIVESGDTPQEALLLLFEALTGYIEAARKIKDKNVLNQKTNSEYERIFVNSKNKKPFLIGSLDINQILKGSLLPA
jgi:predicted RNase H-like HicB family nuclease